MHIGSGAARLACVLVLALFAGLVALPARADSETVFAASARLGERGSIIATTDGGGLRYSQHRVTIPASHRPGGLSPEFVPQPIASHEVGSEFAEALVVDAEARHGAAEVLVLVHGFNTSFTGGLRRAAQVQADFDIAAGMVLFSWPAGSRIGGYAADADRAAAAVPRLSELLHVLAGSRATRIVIVGHSLGARLVMDTLAEMRSTGAAQFFEKFGGVALLSPDLGAAEFAARVTALGELPRPVVAYVSKADVPLRVLADITGRRSLAAVTAAAQLGGAPAIVVDVTAGGARDLAAHYALVGQPNVIPLVNGMPEPDFVRFAELLAAGAMAGVEVDRAGASTLVVLPPPLRR